MLMYLYVREEVRYDRFHKKSDRIFRVIRETWDQQGTHRFETRTSAPLAWALTEDFPEIEHAVRIWNYVTWDGARMQYGDKKYDYGFCLADKNILDVFDLTLIKGNRATALLNPNSILISEQMLQTYFSDEDPIGKVMTAEGRFAGDYKVTGVFKNLPEYSSLQFHFVASEPANSGAKQIWHPPSRKDQFHVQTYIVLPTGYASELLKSKLDKFAVRFYEGTEDPDFAYHLQPLTRIHLHSQYDYGIRRAGEFRGGGDALQVYLLAALAAGILLIGCVNFMNLTTARSGTRAREVAIRKVVGAHRIHLIWQFLGESVVLTLIASVFAIGLVVLCLPTFGQFMGRQLVFLEGNHIWEVFGLCAFAGFVGLVAGSYPAFLLSSFLPFEVLKGALRSDTASLRTTLVIIQFAVTVFFVCGSATIYVQLDYIQRKDLGFTKQDMITFNVFSRELKQRYRTVKRAFKQHPDILGAAASASVPPWIGGLRSVYAEGEEDVERKMRVLLVDEDYINTYQIDLVMGRYFSAHIPTDMTSAFVVNETSVRLLGWENPLGKALKCGTRQGVVIGVVRDFHIRSLHQELPPVVMAMSVKDWTALSLRYKTDDFSSMMAFVEETFRKFRPDKTRFGYWSPAWSHDYLYESERRFSKIVRVLSYISIFVACLGLLGLVAFTAERRTKEIGIRKVLGASVADVVLLLGRRILRLILVANLVALPVAYFFWQRWLENFAYRTQLGMEIFVLSGGSIVFIALVTICYHALRAATANPIEALRYE